MHAIIYAVSLSSGKIVVNFFNYSGIGMTVSKGGGVETLRIGRSMGRSEGTDDVLYSLSPHTTCRKTHQGRFPSANNNSYKG